MPLTFPGPTDRVAILGRTGSGKTTFAGWLLSGSSFDTQPWVIINTKSDPFLNEIAMIEGVQEISVYDTPGEKGLYIVSPLPAEREELDAFFYRIWEKQNCGVYIDEGYMIERTDGLNALLTQGRSRRIPMIVLSQRPAWITKFVFSEADFFSLFQLTRREDRKAATDIIPVSIDYRLAEHCSFWYNVSKNEVVQLGPVPDKPIILDTFRAKFPPEPALADAPLEPVPKRVTHKVVL